MFTVSTPAFFFYLPDKKPFCETSCPSEMNARRTCEVRGRLFPVQWANPELKMLSAVYENAWTWRGADLVSNAFWVMGHMFRKLSSNQRGLEIRKPLLTWCTRFQDLEMAPVLEYELGITGLAFENKRQDSNSLTVTCETDCWERYSRWLTEDGFGSLDMHGVQNKNTRLR